MLFQYTFLQVLAGQKTQTRRIAKPNDQAIYDDEQIIGVSLAGRIKWKVGNTYAIQPKRGSKQVGRLKITAIRREIVNAISLEDAHHEGCDSCEAFFAVWETVHGKNKLDQQVWMLEFELQS